MFPDLSTYKNKRICIAISGGSDSVALLHYFYSRAKELKITLSAVNCEHGIRGEESKKDSLFVRKLCEKYGVPLYFFEENCPALALKRKESVETAARFFRYSCFINTEKSEILAYVRENSLRFREDSTNLETDATRNFLRLEILPELEKRIPGAIKNISAFSSVAASDDEFLYSLAEKELTEKDGELKIKPCAYPIFSRAAIMAMKRMGVVKDYTGEHIKSVYSLLKKENSAEISLPKGITAVNEYGEIRLYKKREKKQAAAPLIYGENIFCGYSITIDKEEGGLRFDKNKLPESAVLRFRQEGDSFKKFGGCGKKLKDFFNEKKIPPRERDFIPLIADGRKIYCVCGVEISDEIKTEENSDVYYIHTKKIQEG